MYLQLQSNIAKDIEMKRMTKQRTAILKCLKEAGRPLCIEEIFAYAARGIPKINLSTIYRTVNTLIQEGIVDLIELPGDKSCYGIHENKHLHYFLCNGCSKTYFIKKCPQGLLDMVPQGFQLADHSITLYGFCRECHS